MRTALISCAGVSSRFGLNMPRCLAPVEGKPLIQWQLDHLQDFEDLIVVVGCQAPDIMRTVLEKRPDAVFAVNHDPQKASLLESMAMGVNFLREPFIYLDGNSLVSPTAIRAMLEARCPSIGIRRTYSENPVGVMLGTGDHAGEVIGFTLEPQDYEWIGMAKLDPQHIKGASDADCVYKALERFLPMMAVEVDAAEAFPIPKAEDLRMAG